jgi:hypothetical protein
VHHPRIVQMASTMWSGTHLLPLLLFVVWRIFTHIVDDLPHSLLTHIPHACLGIRKNGGEVFGSKLWMLHGGATRFSCYLSASLTCKPRHHKRNETTICNVPEMSSVSPLHVVSWSYHVHGPGQGREREASPFFNADKHGGLWLYDDSRRPAMQGLTCQHSQAARAARGHKVVCCS